MRRRKWILVLAAIVTLMAVVGYVSWHLFKANEKIKNILLERVRPFLAEGSDIEQLELDLNSLHLKGVRIVDKQQEFVLEIEDVRVGYQLGHLIRYGFKPYRIAHELTMVRPELILRQVPSIKQETPAPQKTEINYEALVDFIEPLKRISIVDASIVLEDSMQTRARLAKDMNGWFQTSPKDSALIRLSGKVFETDKKNLILNGTLDMTTGRPQWMEVVLEKTEAPENMPMILPPYLRIVSGRVKGYGLYTKQTGISGSAEVQNLSVAFKTADLYFENVNIKSNIQHGVAEVQGAVESFNGSKLDIEGHVHHILKPQLDLHVSCPRFSLPRFFERALPGSHFPVNGQASLRLDIAGALENPRMDGRIHAHTIKASRLTFDTLTTTLQLKDSLLTVRGQALALSGTEMELNGSLDLASGRNDVDVHFDIAGDFISVLPLWFQKHAKNMSGKSKLALRGRLGDIQGEVTGTLALVSLNSDTLRVFPQLTYDDRDLEVRVTSNSALALSGTVYSLFYNSIHWDLHGQGFGNLVIPWAGESFATHLRGYAIAGDWGGKPSQWQLKVNTANQYNAAKQIELTIDARKIRAGDVQYHLAGNVLGEAGASLPVQMQANRVASQINVHSFQLGDLVQAQGVYSFVAKRFEKSKLEVSVQSLKQLHPFFVSSQPFEGAFHLAGEIDGSLNKPNWALACQLKEGTGYGKGVFEGEFESRAEKGQFQTLQLNFRQNDVPVLKGKLTPLGDGQIAGLFKGDLVDFGEILASFTGKEDLLTALGTMEIAAFGQRDCPVFQGNLNLHDGHIKGFPFTQLSFQWLDSLCTPGQRLNNRLHIQDCKLTRNDGFSIQAKGFLPTNLRDEVDIVVRADGNLLALLPEMSSFFTKGRSEGYAQLHFAGKLNDWALGQLEMGIEQGNLEMVTFARKVNHLTAKLSLRNEERFLAIERLTGNVEDGQFFISNRPGNPQNDDDIPISLEALGLNLGVLELKTEEKGIPVQIPGLMESGEEGWIHFKGLNHANSFIITGPSDAITLQGTLLLRNSRITYPFLKGSGGSKADMGFLKALRWNLCVIPEQDVHYIREVKSPFGNVYTDLKLQDERGEIHVAGGYNEGTLQVWGNLSSTEGSLDVLDHYFRAERLTFNYPRGASPILSGRAYTTIIDSTGMPSTVWLSVNAMDDEEVGVDGVSWDNIQFRFSTDNPNLGRTEADLLAALGYSSEDLKDRAYDVLGNSVDNLVFRPFIRPLEREMRRYLGLDMVRLSSMFSRNLAELRSVNTPTFDPRILLRSTRLMLGKYLAPGFFISYSGQVQHNWEWQYQEQGLGFRHALSLEYAIQPDLFLEMEYTYDSQLLHDRREDKRIWLRHTFPF